MRIKALTTLAVIVVFIGVSGPASAGRIPRSYPMKCRGGGNMTMDIKNIRPGRNSEVRVMNIMINFKKAKNSNRLRLGECSWRDREIRPNEPSRLWISPRGDYPNLSKRIFFNRVNWTTKGAIKRIETSSRALNNLLAAASKGREFNVHVFNEANLGQSPRGTPGTMFIVTRLGY